MKSLVKIIFAFITVYPLSVNAQSNVPEDLTDGIIAFTCESDDVEINLMLLDNQSEWQLLGARDGLQVTKIDNGFLFEDVESVGSITYLQQESIETWNLRSINEAESVHLVCKNEKVLVAKIAEGIASKVLENGQMLSTRNVNLSQEISNLESQLAAERQKSMALQENLDNALEIADARQLQAQELQLEEERLAELRRAVEAGEGGAIDVFINTLLEMPPLDRWRTIRDSPLNNPPSSLSACVLSLRTFPERFDDDCRAEVAEYLLSN